MPLTRPPDTLCPSDGERDGVRGGLWHFECTLILSLRLASFRPVKNHPHDEIG